MVKNQNQRATLRDDTQWFVGGIEHQRPRHSFPSLAKRLVYLAPKHPSAWVFTSDI